MFQRVDVCLNVCMFERVYVVECVYACVCRHARNQTHIHARTHTHTHTHAHTHAHTHTSNHVTQVDEARLLARENAEKEQVLLNPAHYNHKPLIIKRYNPYNTNLNPPYNTTPNP